MVQSGWKGAWLGVGLALFGSCAAAAAPPQNASAPARLAVDLRESARRIFHARLILPVKPGPMTLLYPKWIPGEHAPDGPIADLVGLQFTAGGKTLPWRRDDLDLYAFHIDVPEGSVARRELRLPLARSRRGLFRRSNRRSGAGGAGMEPRRALSRGPADDPLTYQASLHLPQHGNLPRRCRWKSSKATTSILLPCR